MCIIIVKPQGVALPEETIFAESFANNPHGAGLMWHQGGEVRISKGFMSYGQFAAALEGITADIDATATAMVFHFRITTQGGTSPGNTHPYPLSAQEANLTACQARARLGVAHNGIISLTSGKNSSKKDAHLNDTQLFIRDYLSIIDQRVPDWYTRKDMQQLVQRMIDSKFAILDGQGHCTTLGAFITEDGLLFSNDSYLPRPAHLWYFEDDLYYLPARYRANNKPAGAKKSGKPARK